MQILKITTMICRIEYILFGLLCTVSIYTYSQDMVDKFIAPKWHLTIYILVFSVLIILIKSILYNSLSIKLKILSRIIAILCILQAIYGITQYFQWIPSHSIANHMITGSFDNPAGFVSCLCCGLPFVLLCLNHCQYKYLSTIIYISAVTILIAVLLSSSRTGIISATLCICIFIYTKFHIIGKFRIFIIGGFFFLLLGSYFLKKQSADGRILIWKCSWEMFKDSPIYGHGMGAFQKKYMYYQAEYFKEHPNSVFTTLADNVSSPFNEYLNVMLNWGIIGLVLLLSFVVLLIFYYYKNTNQDSQIALISLISIATLSLFSYPYNYPFTWIITFVDIYIIISKSCPFGMPRFYKTRLFIILLFPYCILAYKIQQHIHIEMEYNSTRKEKTLAEYSKLYPILKENKFFLYNYAMYLYNATLYKKSLQIALQCKKYWADYNLELVIGDIYKLQHNYETAEQYYKNAAYMCPCRFIPLYSLLELYKEQKDALKIRSVAQIIVNKPIKINSLTVMQIKFRAQQEIIDSHY